MVYQVTYQGSLYMSTYTVLCHPVNEIRMLELVVTVHMLSRGSLSPTCEGNTWEGEEHEETLLGEGSDDVHAFP